MRSVGNEQAMDGLSETKPLALRFEGIERLLQRITGDVEMPERGILVHRVGSAYRFGTKPHHYEDLK